MVEMPMENQSSSDPFIAPPIMDVPNGVMPSRIGRMGNMNPMNPMSRGATFKSINNVKLVQEDGEVKTPNPLVIYSLTATPSGKLTVFLRRASGTVDGGISIYGSFKENPTITEKIALVENFVWTDELVEIVSAVSNPFPVLIIDYKFLSNEDTTIEVNLSSF